MHHLIEGWFHWVQTGGYAAVFWLMALESTFFPIPSEVVIPPAAIVAAATRTDTGQLSCNLMPCSFHSLGLRAAAM